MVGQFNIRALPPRRRDFFKVLRGKFTPYVALSESHGRDWVDLLHTPLLDAQVRDGTFSYRGGGTPRSTWPGGSK